MQNVNSKGFCEYEINSEKFKDFCANVFVAYQKKYPWYPMSPTVHKVLVHGYQIIDTCLVPVGCLGEHASESRNKLYKSDRRGHAKKCSRLDNITDVFNRSMDTSDPLLSSTYLKERPNTIKKKTIPAEVISLLQAPHLEIQCENDDPDSTQNSSDEDYDELDGLEVIASEDEYFELEEN